MLGPIVAPQAVRGVVLCHAMSHLAATMISPNGGRPNAWKLMQALGAVFPTVVSDQAGDSWGNDSALTGVSGCQTFLQGASSPCRAKAGTVLLVGVSMGFQVACAWARANLSLVSGIVGVLPAVDVDDLYTRNASGATAALNTAYGGTYSTGTNGPTRDPLLFASQLTVPIRLFYADDDPTALPARVAAFAAAAPQCTTVSIGNIGGHDTEASYPPALANGLVPFLTANA